MDTYLAAAAKYGLELLLIFALVWFLAKKVWPRLLKQADDAQLRLDQQSKSFLDTLTDQRKEFLDALSGTRADAATTLSNAREDAAVLFSEHREMIHTQHGLLRTMSDTLSRVDEHTKPQRRK